MKHWTAALLLAAFACAPTPVRGQAETFKESLEVTAVEVMIEVRDRKGRVPDDLTPEDFEALEDGEPVPVIGLDYPPRPRPDDRGSKLPPHRPPEQAWRFVVYFQSVLSNPRTTKKVAESLFRQASELTAMGSVEVVMADPLPEVVLTFSRDPERVQEALQSLVKPRRSMSELARIRRNFLLRRDMRIQVANEPATVQLVQATGQIRAAVLEEQQLIDRQMDQFSRWLDTYGNQPASAVFLVTDGFDIDPGEFYLQATAVSGVEQELTKELFTYRFDERNQRLAQDLSARGWTGLMLSPRGVRAPEVVTDVSVSGRERFRSIAESSSAGPGSASLVTLLERPMEPLNQLAQESGGDVVTSLRKTGEALERLGQRLRLTYQVGRPADGKRHKLEIRLRRGDLELQAPRWTSSPTPAEIGGSRARRALALGRPTGELPVEARLRYPEGPQRAQLSILFDLNALREVLPGSRFPVRFTIGVSLPDGSFVHEMMELVEVPEVAADARLPRFNYTVVLDLPPKAAGIAVVVEEPSTGSWGGNVAGQPVTAP